LNHQKLPEKARLSGAISIGSVRNRTPLYDKKGLVIEEEFKRVGDPEFLGELHIGIYNTPLEPLRVTLRAIVPLINIPELPARVSAWLMRRL
jgi:hypothetical protein